MVILSKKDYNTLHQRNLRKYKKLGKCLHCMETKKTEWSNISGNYFDERADWQELCRQCHIKYDRNVLKVKRGKRKRRAKIPVPEGFCIADME